MYIYNNKTKLNTICILYILIYCIYITVICIGVNCLKVFAEPPVQSVIVLKESPNFNEDKEKYSITLKYQNKSFTLTRKDFEYQTNIHTIQNDMQKFGRLGYYKEKLYYINKIKQQGYTIYSAYNFVFADFNSVLEKIAHTIETDPINSTIAFNPDNYPNMFSVKREVPGIKVDMNALYRDIDSAFCKSSNAVINIQTLSVAPEITADFLLQSMIRRSIFSTSFATSSAERKNNINLALSALNGFRLNAGDTASFNAITGKRLPARGYQEANIIKDGLFVPGTGGGVCQVSTTLYNALIRADLKVEEVHKHSIPVSYVELGFDAMVSGSSSDLKFKNTTALPIFIRTYAQNDRAYIEVYGKSLGDLVLKPRKEIINTTPCKGDETIKDEKGEYKEYVKYIGQYYRVRACHDGYEINTFMQYYLNGVLIAEKQLRHVIYEPVNGLLVEGTETPPPTPEPADREVPPVSIINDSTHNASEMR